MNVTWIGSSGTPEVTLLLCHPTSSVTNVGVKMDSVLSFDGHANGLVKSSLAPHASVEGQAFSLSSMLL